MSKKILFGVSKNSLNKKNFEENNNNLFITMLGEEDSNRSKFVINSNIVSASKINRGVDYITLGWDTDEDQNATDVYMGVIDGNLVDNENSTDPLDFSKKMLAKTYNNSSFTNKNIKEELVSFFNLEDSELEKDFNFFVKEVIVVNNEADAEEFPKGLKSIICIEPFDEEKHSSIMKEEDSVSISEISSIDELVKAVRSVGGNEVIEEDLKEYDNPDTTVAKESFVEVEASKKVKEETPNVMNNVSEEATEEKLSNTWQ